MAQPSRLPISEPIDRNRHHRTSHAEGRSSPGVTLLEAPTLLQDLDSHSTFTLTHETRQRSRLYKAHSTSLSSANTKVLQANQDRNNFGP